MSQAHLEYPSLYKACLEISICNNGIRRDRPIENQIDEFNVWALQYDYHCLMSIDTWLSDLDKEEILLITDGEYDEIQLFLKENNAPFDLNKVLDSYFNEVC